MNSIVLCETNEEDYEAYYKIRCTPSDIYWNGYTSKPDKEQFRRIFLNRLSSARFEFPEDRRLFLVKYSNEVNCCEAIGFVQLIKREDGVEIGYSILDEFQGKGIGTIVVKEAINLAKDYSSCVYARIRDDNIASQIVAIKNGFNRTNKYYNVKYPKCGIVKLRVYKIVCE